MRRHHIIDNPKWDIYCSLRDDISLLLCEMGRICDLHEHTEEYDQLFNIVAQKLLELDIYFASLKFPLAEGIHLDFR